MSTSAYIIYQRKSPRWGDKKVAACGITPHSPLCSGGLGLVEAQCGAAYVNLILNISVSGFHYSPEQGFVSRRWCDTDNLREAVRPLDGRTILYNLSRELAHSAKAFINALILDLKFRGHFKAVSFVNTTHKNQVHGTLAEKTGE